MAGFGLGFDAFLRRLDAAAGFDFGAGARADRRDGAPGTNVVGAFRVRDDRRAMVKAWGARTAGG